MENVCWACDVPIYYLKPAKPYKAKEKIVEIAEKSHSYWIMGEIYLLQASLALITLDLKEARLF